MTAADHHPTPLIPSERLEELIQLVKDSTTTPLFRLSINESRRLGLTDTKLGGIGYWPKGEPWPTTCKGLKLMLLAQLDLADFGGCDPLPDHGLLQFFIDSDDDCSGMDFDVGTNQDGFRVVWHESLDPAVTEDDIRNLDIPTSNDSWTERLGNPLRGSYALDVESSTGCISPADDRFDGVFINCARRLLGNEYVRGRDGWYDCLTREDSDRLFDHFDI